jgi:parallel beta-helix repeat protein
MDLKAHFEDAEDPDTDLVYTIEGNTNPALFNSATIVSGSTFRLDYGADLNGTSDITIRATDTGGLLVESTFTVTINPVNDAPSATADPGGYLALLSAQNPTSHWRLGEINGTTAADIGAAGNAGTYHGGALAQAGALAGDADGSVYFDGTEYVEIAHTNDYLLDEGTIQLWFKADGAANGDLQHLFSKDSQGFDTGGHLSLYLDESGRLEARLQSATSDYIVTSSTVTSSGEWHHAALSFGSAGMSLYLDGNLVDSNAYTGGLGTSSGGTGNFEPIIIGGGTQVSGNLVATPVDQFFVGSIDEVAVLGGQLDAATVQGLYAAGIQSYTIPEDGTLVVGAVDGVLANDLDVDGDSLTAILVSGPSNAQSFTLNPDGSFSYTPTANFFGTDTFTYKANDGTLDSNVTTVTLTVTPVNDAPIAVNDTANVDEGSSVVIDLAGNDTDIDSSLDLTSIVITSAPVNGTLIDNGDGTLIYSHDGSETVGDSFSYTIKDASGTTSDIATVTLTVSPQNDAPTISAPAGQYTGYETPLVFSSVGGNAISVGDIDAGSNLIELSMSVSHGTITLSSTTGLTFSSGANGSGSFTLSGSVADVNAALDGMTYDATTGYRGLDSLQIAIDDLGNSGGGGALTALDSTSLHVGALVVTNTSDSTNGDTASVEALVASDGGDGISLREAILASNASSGTNHIYFDLSGPGLQLITLTGPLPTIDDTVVIDGSSEPDFGGTPMIELDGSAAGAGASGITLGTGSDGPTIRGLVINRFAHSGIRITDSDNNTIAGNYIGTDATGNVQAGSDVQGTGITIFESSGNVIGGTASGDANVLSGNRLRGVLIEGSTATGNQVLGNFIGTTADGGAALTNIGGGQQIGVYLYDAPNNTIGGTDAASANVISGNITYGLYAWGPNTTGNSIQGNTIGLDAARSTAIGNGDASGSGIMLSNAAGNLVGGTSAGAGNVIAGNPGAGLGISGSGATGNAILSNEIYGNGSIGIDLGMDDVTGNDAGDADTGPNQLQNFPVLSAVLTDGVGDVTIEGSLDSAPNQAYRLEFFASASADSSGHGEAERYLGFTTITTDATGAAVFSATLSEFVASGEFVTATATVDLGAGSYGASSEFSANVGANSPPTAVADSTSLNEGGSVVINLAGNDTDPDNALDLSSIVITSAPANGTLVDNGDGTLTYSHDGSETVGDSFSYTIDDASGATSNVASVTLSINPINDAPSISDQFFSVNENTAAGAPVGTILASDPDTGDSLVFAIESGNVGGAFAIDPTSGDLFVANSSALDFESNPTIGLIVRAEDNSGSSSTAQVRVNVLDINEAVTISAPTRVDLVEGQVATFSSAAGTAISISDPDAATNMMEATVNAPSGTFTLGSSIGLSFIVGDGIDDPTITVRGTASDVATALDGLVFTPTGIGGTNLTIGVTDLAPGGVSAQSVVSVNTSASASPVPPSPALFDLSDLNLDPEPEPEPQPDSGSASTDTTEPSEDNVTTTEKESRASTTPWLDIQDVSPDTGSRAYGSGHLRIRSADVTGTSERSGVSPLTAEMRELERDPYEQNEIVMRPSPEDVLAESLDQMRRDVLDDADREGEEEDLWMRPALQSMALAAFTGVQFLILRAGSLLAMALSWVPMWRRADPLMILSLSDEERRDLQDSMRHADSGEQDLDAMLDGRSETDKDDDDDEEPSA